MHDVDQGLHDANQALHDVDQVTAKNIKNGSTSMQFYDRHRAVPDRHMRIFDLHHDNMQFLQNIKVNKKIILKENN